MFVPLKDDFGFTTQSLSMFIAVNTEFGCVLQPNSPFKNVNTDFGWRARATAARPARSASGAGRRRRVARPAGASSP